MNCFRNGKNCTAGLGQLQRQTRALAEGVMQRSACCRFHFVSTVFRMVRDGVARLEEEIELILTGESIQVDKR